MAECLIEKLAHRMRFARRDDVILRLVLLKHQPHGLAITGNADAVVVSRDNGPITSLNAPNLSITIVMFPDILHIGILPSFCNHSNLINTVFPLPDFCRPVTGKVSDGLEIRCQQVSFAEISHAAPVTVAIHQRLEDNLTLPLAEAIEVPWHYVYIGCIEPGKDLSTAGGVENPLYNPIIPSSLPVIQLQ